MYDDPERYAAVRRAEQAFIRRRIRDDARAIGGQYLDPEEHHRRLAAVVARALEDFWTIYRGRAVKASDPTEPESRED